MLGEVYFRDGGHRAHDLLAELTDIEQIQFELQTGCLWPVGGPRRTTLKHFASFGLFR
ncbi:hypothetical protein [Streptomyces cinereoruber]|uniref:hypothetical protein n=1 Tax=Streptomyces cinereoruber TaxID=67260 RepID=UPI00362D60E5